VDDFDYGAHEFGIRDDNGYHLAFGAPSKKPKAEIRRVTIIANATIWNSAVRERTQL
jgi:hypothetical protein